jgi:type I restriction enzyme, S subunit
MTADLKYASAAPDFAVKNDWRVLRLWDIAKMRSEKNRPELPLLSVFLNRGVIAYNEGGGQVHKPGLDLSIYQVVRPGDFVLNNQQAWRGSVGVSKHYGIISPAYVVLALSQALNPRYADYLFQSRDMVAQFVTSSKGVGDIQRDIHMPWLKNVKVPIPPDDEQASIVRFLHNANAQLERTIRAKRGVIALLNEQKQAIIHRAVTRGLDPSVPLKPSGIPWLGDIPQHWQVRRAKYLFREVDERSTDGSEELLSVSHLTGVTPRSQKNITMFKAASYARHKLCRPGDLVVNTMWAWMGALGVSTYAGIISPAYAVYRPRQPAGIVGIYMDGLLRSRPYVSNIICRSTGLRASRLRLYPEEFFRLPIIQPPAEEQHQIVERIHGETAELDVAITRLEREIELLREYRTRLVADVVTGKLDVREIAARLPEEAMPEDTVADDADLIGEQEADEVEVAA